jgi:hypothetical protein
VALCSVLPSAEATANTLPCATTTFEMRYGSASPLSSTGYQFRAVSLVSQRAVPSVTNSLRGNSPCRHGNSRITHDLPRPELLPGRSAGEPRRGGSLLTIAANCNHLYAERESPRECELADLAVQSLAAPTHLVRGR